MTARGTTAPAGALSRRTRIVILVTCSLSLFIVSMDTTIVNVALPSIQRDFKANLDGLQWVIDAYILVLASLLILSGSTGDRIGRRRVFKTGLIVFGVGSLACSLAPSLPTLVAFRMLQAIGGSMLNPNSLSIVSNVFTEPRARARAIGIWGGVFGVSMAAGPIVGGLLTDSVGWRAVFWVNIPIVLVALWLTSRYVPESRAPKPRRIDVPGQLLAIVLLGSLCYAIVEGPSDGWGSAAIVGSFTCSALSLGAFLAVERRRFEPLLDLRFFRSPLLSSASLIAVLAFLVIAGFLFLNTLYLQDARGDSALIAGLSILPVSAVIVVVAPLTGRVVGRFGPRVPLAVAGLLMAAGAVVLSRMQVSTAYGQLAAGYMLLGMGFGIVNPPITNSAVSGMPNAQAGTAAAIASTSRQVGSALGVAVTGSIVHGGTALLAVRHGSRAALREQFALATHPAWYVCIACGLAVTALAVATNGAWGRRRAQAAARLFEEQRAAVEMPA